MKFLSNKEYKLSLNNKSFIGLLSLIALFIAIFSINFLVLNLLSKQELVNKYLGDKLEHNINPSDEEFQKVAIEFNKWNLGIYIGGISTLLIFAIFVIFGKKNTYGYFFRVSWLLLLIAAAIFVFWSPYKLWLNVVVFFIFIAMAAVMLYELFRIHRNVDMLRLEKTQDWYNKNERGNR